MATINECLEALRTTITDATGIRCVDIVDSPPSPCCMVYPCSPFDESYYAAFKRGVFNLDVIVQPCVSSTALRSAQTELNEWLSPNGEKSIGQAIYEHPTLGSSATESTADPLVRYTASIQRVDEYGLVDAADNTRYLSAKVHVRIMTRGDS